MKKSIIFLVLVIPVLSFGQYDYEFWNESFLGRQPSARAEALGKGYCSIDGDLATIFYNPAGTATLQGAVINTSFASPYYFSDEQYGLSESHAPQFDCQPQGNVLQTSYRP